MTHSIDNLEKLIQLATMEQMYNLLNKLKSNVNDEPDKNNINKENNRIITDNTNDHTTQNTPIFTSHHMQILNSIVTQLQPNFNTMKNILAANVSQVDNMKSKISSLENEINKLKVNLELAQTQLNTLHDKGDNNITLKIEEKTVSDLSDKEEEKVEEEEEEAEEEEEEEEEVEEEEEEEVGTEEEQEEEEEEEGEEVFEIEIDDTSYFATDEENGILYEMTSDGDIGNKVGIIKNGEPIFS
jgi:hypothetical protein